MIDLDYLAKIYSSQHLGGDELEHIKTLSRVKEWFSKSDIEKQESRKSYLRSTKINFREEDGIEYIEQSIIVVDCILDFLSQSNFLNMEFEKCSSETEKSMFRICNMLWCEKEYILYMENPRATKIHVSMDIFKPLIGRISNTNEFSESKLKMLFTEYIKMLELFKTAYPN